MTTSRSDAERRHALRHALNAAIMAEERIQEPAATTPAASAPTAPYAHHRPKEPQAHGGAPTEEARKVNSVHITGLNSVHITRTKSARAGLKY